MDQDKINQIVGLVVAMIIGVLSWFKGARSKPTEVTESGELSRLRDKLAEDRNTKITDAFESVREDILAIRKDFEAIINSLNVKMTDYLTKIGEDVRDLETRARSIEDRMHNTERKLDVVEDRQKRQ